MPGLTDSKDGTHAQEIIPEPFYFVKLSDREGQKTFINMCGCSEIAAPGEWQNGAPLELEESFNLMESDSHNAQNLRFSLSCSELIWSTDKQGNLCKVYDVIFNQTVMRHSMVHKQLRTFLINMAITWINKKYGLELKSEYKVPRGKYKGEAVRKHHIRALKAQLVTEIPDADEEMQPSFPLLSIKPSQTLDLQSNKSTISEKADTSRAPFESVMGMSESPKNRSPSCLLEKQATMSSQHEEVSKGFSSLVPEGPHHDRGLKAQEVEKMDNKRHKETVLCGSSSSTFSDRISGQCESAVGELSEVCGMEPTQCYSEKTPLILTKFLGCPMELVVLWITFPSSVEVHEVKLWVSNTELHVEAGSFDPIMVSLVFPTSPSMARASFIYSEQLLKVYLPYLPYTLLLK